MRWLVGLVSVLAPREVRIRYRQSALDIAWALITPLSILAVYGFVLTQSFDVNGGATPYLSMAWSGIVLWTFFAGALQSAASSLIQSGDLVTKVYFPREAVPLSMVGASFIDLAIGLSTVFVLAPALGARPTWDTLLFVLPLAVLIIWTAALSVLSGVLAAFIRDIPHVISLVVRVGFFLTPVVYDASSLPESIRWSAKVNPIAAAIDGFRVAVLQGEQPDLVVLFVQLLLGSALFVAVLRYTRAVETRLTDLL
jgi:lipopolysaccharide transport system permease protein